MPGTELAKAYVQIIPSMRGIQGKLAEEIGGEGAPAGNKFASMFKKAAAAAGIGIAVKKVISDSISEGAALQQSIGGVETLFKGSADKLKGYANEAYQTAGLSANAYMEQVTSFSASLLQSLGGDTNAAADVANMALIDMSDNANKFGTDMVSIQDAYQGFAKQNYTMLDNLKLGYGGTKEEMSRLLSDAQKLTGVKYDINNLSDVYNAIHAIQENLDITGTTAKEASTTWTGSLAAVSASYKNLMANIMLGNDLGPSLSALTQTIVTFVSGNLLPAVGNIITGIPQALWTLVTTLGPELMNMGANLLSQLTIGIETQMPIMLTEGVNLITNFVNGIFQNLPTLVTTAGTLLTQFVDTVIQSAPQVLASGATLVLNLVNGVINNLPAIVTAVSNVVAKFLTTIGQNLPQILQSGIEIVGKLAAGLIRAIPNLVARIPEIINAVKNAFENTDWLSIGTNIIRGIANGLSSAGSMLWDTVKGILGSFKENVLAFFGIHSPSRWGEYVGKMIMLGIPNGLNKNMDPFRRSMQLLADYSASPIRKAIPHISSTTTVEGISADNSVEEKLEYLIQILLMILKNGNKEISITVRDREAIRVLRDLGVSFV